MSCVQYNLLKEGSLNNSSTTVSGVKLLSPTEVIALCNGDVSTPAVLISGSPQFIHLKQEFGEGFDVCHIRYHTDESNPNRILGYYSGNDSEGPPTPLSWFLEFPGIYRAEVNSFVRFVDIVHTVSGTAAVVNEIEIFGVRNDVLGFGNISAQIDHYAALHSTSGTLSAEPNVISLYNDSPYDDVARVAVAPTLSEADRYLFLSTISSGIYYGINGYGFTQPGPNPVRLVDDDMLSENINQQWEVRAPAQAHKVIPTFEGLVFELAVSGPITGTSTAETTGLYSKEAFTATSFTAEVQIRFLGIDNTGFDPTAKDFFFVLTNSFPIPDVGYNGSWLTDRRRGASVAGVQMEKPFLSSQPLFPLNLRWVDGSSAADPRAEILDHRWTKGDGSGFFGFTPPGEVGEIVGPALEDFEDILLGGQESLDFTDVALWHTWKIVYDAERKQISAYADNIHLGDRSLKIEPFNEACRLFIGFHGYGGVKWALRNFKIHRGVVYRQSNLASYAAGGVASATISGSQVFKVIDESTSSVYVAPAPTANTHVRIDFGNDIDLAYYKIKQHSAESAVSAYGSSYFADIARQVLVDFGGKKLETHLLPSTSDFVIRAPFYSEDYPTVISGISYIDFQFVQYDRTNQTNGALIIDEIQVFSEVVRDVGELSMNEREIPWVEGRWVNLRQYGNSTALVLKDRNSIMPSYYPIPEYFLEGVDYGFSSAIPGRQDADKSNEYHFAGTLFSGPIDTGALGDVGADYRQWHSNNQSDNHIFIWRYFSEQSNIQSVYWNSITLRPGYSNVADRFKFQYLAEDGDPNHEEDWINIPPIRTQHLFTGGQNNADSNYKNYKNYLITHTDGEYYTDYFLMPNFGDGFSISSPISSLGVPKGLVVPEDYIDGTLTNVFLGNEVYPSANGGAGYVEFDSPILTRAIRMVVHTCIDSGREEFISGLNGDQGTVRTQFALRDMFIFRTHGSGSYMSPVIDTGTPQNTERIYVDVKEYDNTSYDVYVRSSPQRPEYQYSPTYEVWESLGDPGNLDISFRLDSGGFSTPDDRAVTRQDVTYFIRQENVKTYNHVARLWGEFQAYSVSNSSTGSSFEDDESFDGGVFSSKVAPDTLVHDNVALVGDRLYIATRTIGDNQIPRFAYFDFNNQEQGWVLSNDNRPPVSENAAMAADYDRNRLYFFNRDGTVSYYDIASNNWIIESFLMPTFGGLREFPAIVSYSGRIYIFGGRVFSNGTTNCSVFDLEKDEFMTVANAPYRIECAQAVVVPEEGVIYVFPITFTGSSFRAIMKYHIDSDVWEVCESLMWFRDLTLMQDFVPDYHFYYDGYIYRMDSSFGLSRAYVKRVEWVQGKMPDFKDNVWGGKTGSSIPWIRVDSFGELMPQERYLQLKVELYSEDKVNSPVLESVTVVTPQDVFIPSSGTANIYLKIGVSPEELYQAWYSADKINTGVEPLLDNDYSIMYTQSSNGKVWQSATVVSGTWLINPSSSLLEVNMVSSPWVIKESTDEYKFWFTKNFKNQLGDKNEQIYYKSGTAPYSLSGEVLSVAKNIVPHSVNGAKHPCVLKESASSYMIWYTGIDSVDKQRIIRASSSDGVSWSGHTVAVNLNNVPYDINGAYRPCVLKADSLYRMWYTGVDFQGIERILYTQSFDAVSWEHPQVVIDIASEGELDRWGCSKAFVLKDTDRYIVYYIGYSGQERYIIRATSPDGLQWFDFLLSIPSGGLLDFIDGDGLEDIFVILNKESVVPGSLIEGAQIKLYNKEAAL